MADTPGTAILGLPTSERLRVIALNCAVRITHEPPKLLDKISHNIGEHDGTLPQQEEWENKSYTRTLVPLHIQWLRLPRVDIYHQRSNILKNTQIAVKELEDFLEPTRHTSKMMQS